jgi:hypothetical protein
MSKLEDRILKDYPKDKKIIGFNIAKVIRNGYMGDKNYCKNILYCRAGKFFSFTVMDKIGEGIFLLQPHYRFLSGSKKGCCYFDKTHCWFKLSLGENSKWNITLRKFESVQIIPKF